MPLAQQQAIENRALVRAERARFGEHAQRVTLDADLDSEQAMLGHRQQFGRNGSDWVTDLDQPWAYHATDWRLAGNRSRHRVEHRFTHRGQSASSLAVLTESGPCRLEL